MEDGDGNNGKQGRRPRRPRRGSGKKDDQPAIWTGYGKLVKFFRGQAGLTQEQLAEAVGYSLEQVSSIERGRRPAKDQFTLAADRVLTTGGALAALQSEVDRAKLPQFFQDFAGIETEAVSRFDYDPLLVPGLLQTEDCARALISGHCPALDAETVEQRVEARLNRQKLLWRRPAVELSFIIGEAALRNRIGNEELMQAQLRHLLEMGSLPNVELQIMPLTLGVHIGLDGAFVLLETLEHQHYGYIEAQQVGLVIGDPEKVSAFGMRYGRLRSQALNVEESGHFIERLVGAA